MILFLTRHDLESVLDVESAIGVVELGYKEGTLGTTELPARPWVNAPKYGAGWGNACLLGRNCVSLSEQFGPWLSNDRRHDSPSRCQDWFPLSIMDGAYIAGMRTGAAAAVATKYLARHAAGKVALIGRGVVGGSALTVIVKVRKLGNVTVYDIIPYHTRKYVEEMEAKLRTTVTSAQDPDAAVRKADIIVTVTTLEAGISRRPNLTGCAH